MRPIDVPRANVLGVGVSAVNLARATGLFEEWIESGRRGYVCVTGVHGVMEAQRDEQFRRILNGSLLTTPDGTPTVWVGRSQGFRVMDRVFGPDLMLGVCEMSSRRGYTHFLYGGRSGVAERLRATLKERFPGLQVVGTYTPPFGPLTPERELELRERVAAVQPDVVWVGLSTPKQERWMAEFSSRLDSRIFVGVGAAFDYLTGDLQDAPDWVKRSGLQWLHRLKQEPRRLWKRYLTNNPAFLFRITLQLVGLSHYTI
jgi:N-acetylglucosaminyldiphosphoundecaprenol N-acetyl-beta-D-mannosaminyltransferase